MLALMSFDRIKVYTKLYTAGDNHATKKSRQSEKSIKLKLTGLRGFIAEGVIKTPHGRIIVSRDNRHR